MMQRLNLNFAKTGTFGEVNDQWKSICTNDHVSFFVFHVQSILDEVSTRHPNFNNKEDNMVLFYPNLLSEHPLLKGEWTLKTNVRPQLKMKVANPTWKLIADFLSFTKNASGNNGIHYGLDDLLFDEEEHILELVVTETYE